MKTVILLALLAHVYANIVVPQATVSPHIQHIAEQHINHIVQHVPAVQDHINKVKEQHEVKPSVVVHVPVVTAVKNEKDLPENTKNFINQHINHIVKHVKVQRVPQQVLAEHLANTKTVPQVPTLVQAVVEQVHHHVPQVINNHVVQKVPQVVSEKVAPHSIVPSHVQNVVNQVHQHIPQILSHAVTSQKVPQVGDKVPVAVSEKVGLPSVPHLVPDKVRNRVKEIVQQAHSHIPQVLSHHIEQQKKQEKVGVPADKVPVVPADGHIVITVHDDKHHHHHHHHKTTRALNVPSNIHGVVQHAHQHIPQVINFHHQHPKPDHKPTSKPPHKCEFNCTRLDMSVCATNGKCWKKFDSACQLSKWNCLNTQTTFHQVHDADCHNSKKPKCYTGDM